VLLAYRSHEYVETREVEVRYVLLAVAILIVPACGSSKSGFGTSTPASILPVAIVPESKKVLVNASGVALDG